MIWGGVFLPEVCYFLLKEEKQVILAQKYEVEMVELKAETEVLRI